MNRKYSHITLVILLLVGSTGFIVNSHFCGETLRSQTVNSPAQHCDESDQMPEGCCHDETKEYELDEYQVQKTDFSFNYLGVVLFTIQYFVSLDDYGSNAIKSQLYNSKPASPPGSKIFMKIQSFLI